MGGKPSADHSGLMGMMLIRKPTVTNCTATPAVLASANAASAAAWPALGPAAALPPSWALLGSPSVRTMRILGIFPPRPFSTRSLTPRRTASPVLCNHAWCERLRVCARAYVRLDVRARVRFAHTRWSTASGTRCSILAHTLGYSTDGYSTGGCSAGVQHYGCALCIPIR